MGKQINIEANKKLRAMYQEIDKPWCEICGGTSALSPHHYPFKSSGFYINNPELLSSLKHTLLLCHVCHKLLHDMKQLNEDVFKRLRGE